MWVNIAVIEVFIIFEPPPPLGDYVIVGRPLRKCLTAVGGANYHDEMSPTALGEFLNLTRVRPGFPNLIAVFVIGRVRWKFSARALAVAIHLFTVIDFRHRRQ